MINSLGVRRARGSNDQLRLSTNYNTQALFSATAATYISLSLTCAILLSLPPPRYLKMGWLPWSSDPTKASDGGRIAPDRSSRARCWEGRDRFFACLDQHDILDANKDDKEARRKCAKEVAEFEAACSQTWVRERPPAWQSFLYLLWGSFTALLLSCSRSYAAVLAIKVITDELFQVKYFKEKRVMEYNRDRTIERIKKEDAAQVQQLKSQGSKS